MTTALIIVDLQKGVLLDEGTWDAEGVVRRAQELAERARLAGVPVVWVQHSSPELERGSDAWQLAPGLAPAADEPIIHKHYGDSFEATELEDVLGDTSDVVICGAQTDACIRSTVHGALVRGYNVILVSDTHTCGEFPAEYSGGELLKATTKINALNANLQWGAKYPGRSGTTRKADEIDFR